MSRLIRFLSRRKSGRGVQKNKHDDRLHKPKKGYMVCKVMLLDGSDVSIDLPVSKFASLFNSYHVFLSELLLLLESVLAVNQEKVLFSPEQV